MKHTKIVCTIGPASRAETTLEQMLAAGMNVARLNFSHGSYDDHKEIIGSIRAAAQDRNRSVALLQDLQGPRIRIGHVPEQGIPLQKRDKVVLLSQKEYAGYSNQKYTPVPIQYTKLFQSVQKGSTITIQDGLIDLTVERIFQKRIYCRVVQGGVVLSHKGMNAPGAEIEGPVITAKDKRDIEFGVKQDVDFIALSFVKSEKDIQKLRKLLPQNKGIQIIAKIERAQAVANFDKILEEADGIMIARGDLGSELGPAAVPLLQKQILTKCLRAAKPAIVATQMLESMTDHPQPTRAEAADVANAIIDHTDAVMLSAESATGEFPVKAVQMLTEIAEQVEASAFDDMPEGLIDHRNEDVERGIAHAAVELAESTQARTIAILCRSGNTAGLVAQLRPQKTQIAVFTNNERVYRQLSLVWGVTPVLINIPRTEADFRRIIRRELPRRDMGAKGQSVITIFSNGRKGSKKEVSEFSL